MTAPNPSSPVPPIRVPAGTTAGTAVREAGLPGKGEDAIVVVRVDGGLKDLSWTPEVDTEVEPVAANTEDGRSVIRHSAAHVLAQAVQDLFPKAKLGIGPPITDGFYYDFGIDHAFTPEDLAALEKKMKQIIKEGQRFSRRVYGSVEEAQAELANEPFKLELVSDKSGADDPEVMEVGGDELSAYDNLNPRTGEREWFDLCRGPHIPTTKHIPAFRLTRSSAAYWRGNQANASMQRVYGTAWESKESMDAYLDMLLEAEKRDHRKLAKQLDLFHQQEEAPGMVFWHPRGHTLVRLLEESLRRHMVRQDIVEVRTPQLLRQPIWESSGHWAHFRDAMFVLDADDFPEFSQAIKYSIETKGCWCFEKLDEKRGKAPHPNQVYLRITLGHNGGESPGIPFVMEIWPPQCFSAIHQHAGANAVIRVLHGRIHVAMFPYLRPAPVWLDQPAAASLADASSAYPDDAFAFGGHSFEQGAITWISPLLNQIHRLRNPEPLGAQPCITIQCYQYDEDDAGHYPFFDYDRDESLHQFDPDSDMDFVAFKEKLRQEWAARPRA